MKRSVGGLMLLGGWVIVPSVVIWLLGGPLWAWVVGIGVVGGAVLVFLCVAALFEFIAHKWGDDVAILCVLVTLCLLVIPQALGCPWWITLAALGVLSSMLAGLLGLKWLVDE